MWTQKATELLCSLIRQASFSREESLTGDLIQGFLEKNSVVVHRYLNNIWAVNKYFDPSKPSLLLNSHHDTVKPNAGYTRDPFDPVIEDGKLFGLGSNDAGGCLVSLLTAFLHFYEKESLAYNLIVAATAEEEISGHDGVEALLESAAFQESLQGSVIDAAIVGEPTLMQMAVAERGLMVLDGTAKGKAGHAAREEGENALYTAMADIAWLCSYQFDRVSEFLGPVKMNVTVIETSNKAHNVVPDTCHFVVDVRINECYTFEEVLQTISVHTKSRFQPRSSRLRSSMIPLDHPLVRAGAAQGLGWYGSPTTSDKALMPFPTLKMGPGDSARSHTADEFIYLQEVEQGIAMYIKMLDALL